jgi:hypothetical protein
MTIIDQPWHRIPKIGSCDAPGVVECEDCEFSKASWIAGYRWRPGYPRPAGAASVGKMPGLWMMLDPKSRYPYLMAAVPGLCEMSQ